ncbi:MAG: Gldg family protein [Planctomycetes bacterium]|nr:Gldg family protein [Planctomycetota bacterium]
MVGPDTQTNPPESAPSGKRLRVGTNVLVATLLVVGIVVVLQLMAYKMPVRLDMTSSGVNSLSEGTENLLATLDENIRVTSLYFETDRETEDQQRYRQASRNLLDLYEATNRSHIKSEWINPLKDHEKFRNLIARLREKPAFKKGIDDYRERVDAFVNELDGQIRSFLQGEIELAAKAIGGGIGGKSTSSPVARIELTFRKLSDQLDTTRELIDTASSAVNPQYAAVVNELGTQLPRVSKTFNEIAKFATAELIRNPAMPPEQAEYLRGAGGRFAPVVMAIEGETTKLQDLEPLQIDDLLAQLQPTANALIVETDTDAMVVDFRSVWPALDGQSGATASFEKRAFKGEEKLTAAILRTTHKEQTAVLFVRYGGMPLLMESFMPGQPPSPYSMMKRQLEDANFVVREWDIKGTQTPPDIDPVPTRTIFVVLNPEPPQRGPMGQPSREAPFGDTHLQAVLGAFGENVRALFIAGWSPGPFGPIASTYEFGDYLKDNWGVTVNTGALLIETASTAPGKFNVVRRDFHNMTRLEVTEHDIVSGPQAAQIAFPRCAPLDLAETPPEGVELYPLVTLPRREGIWGIKDLTKYEQQQRQRGYLTKEPADLEGPFDLAVAATNGNAKIVVVSSLEFALDSVAFAQGLQMTARGFTLHSRNPGNVTLLINSLHWLNDNTDFMNVGEPIDAAVLKIPDPSTVRMVKVLTIFVWPVLALGFGGVVWWVRRK